MAMRCEVVRRYCRCGVSIKASGAPACYECRRSAKRSADRARVRAAKVDRKAGVSPWALLYRDAKNDPARQARFAAEAARVAEAVKRDEATGLSKITVGRTRTPTWDEQTYEGVGVWRGQGRRVLLGLRTAG